MPSRTNMDEAIAAWRARNTDRASFICDGERIIAFLSEADRDAAEALLRAAAEPEAKACYHLELAHGGASCLRCGAVLR